MSEERKGGLRELMPATAELVDWLRAELGKEAADKIVKRGQAGKGGFYAAEIGPDGKLREFGSSPSGQRASPDGADGWTWK